MQPGGSSKRDHLKQVERQTGKDLGTIVEVPYDGQFMWLSYWEIRKGKAVTWTDMDAYSRLRGVEFSGWEIDALLAMDVAVEKRLKLLKGA